MPNPNPDKRPFRRKPVIAEAYKAEVSTEIVAHDGTVIVVPPGMWIVTEQGDGEHSYTQEQFVELYGEKDSLEKEIAFALRKRLSIYLDELEEHSKNRLSTHIKKAAKEIVDMIDDDLDGGIE